MMPKEVENNLFTIHDQHCHSNFSKDSKEPIENEYEKAWKLGCKYFVTTEHVDLDILSSGISWLVDFNKLKETLKQLSKKHETIPLLGVEIGYREKYINDLTSIANSEAFDVINLSIHGDDYFDYYYFETFEKYGIKTIITKYYQEMLQAVTNFPKYNVLSHIDYGYKTIYKNDPTYEFLSDIILIKPILQTIIKNNKALEINIKVQRFIGIEHTKELLKLYKSLGGTKLTLSSDSHNIDTYHQNFELYIQTIKECGFDYLCYYVNQKEYHYYI